MVSIQVILPFHLTVLAACDRQVELRVSPPVSIGGVLDVLENRFPTLRGTVRDQVTRKRRPLVRFYACESDLSHESMDFELPEAVTSGREPFIILGAIAGG